MRSDLGNLLKALARLDEAKVCFRITSIINKLIQRVHAHVREHLYFNQVIDGGTVELLCSLN